MRCCDSSYTDNKGPLDVLNVIVGDDRNPEYDFWRTQTLVPIPLSFEVRPTNYHSLAIPNSIRGKRIAIPKYFIRDGDTCLEPNVFTTQFGSCSIKHAAILKLWERHR
jgi:hypothetical protein